jgi:hypothetical protein
VKLKTYKLILLSAIAVLAFVNIALYVFTPESSARTLELDVAVDALEIERADGSELSLEKNGDAWVVGKDKLATEGLLAQALVSRTATLDVLGTVNSSGDFERYGLENNGKMKVTAFAAGKVVRTIIVGKESATAQQTYIRLDDGNDVYLVSGSLAEAYKLSESELVRKEEPAQAPAGAPAQAPAGGAVQAPAGGAAQAPAGGAAQAPAPAVKP